MIAIWVSQEAAAQRLPGGLAGTQRTNPPHCFAQNCRISRNAFQPACFARPAGSRHRPQPE